MQKFFNLLKQWVGGKSAPCPVKQALNEVKNPADWVGFINNSTNLEKTFSSIGEGHISLVSLPKNTSFHGFNAIGKEIEFVLFADNCSKGYVAGLPRAFELLYELVFYVRSMQMSRNQDFLQGEDLMAHVASRLQVKADALINQTFSQEQLDLTKLFIMLDCSQANEALVKFSLPRERLLDVLLVADHWKNETMFAHYLKELGKKVESRLQLSSNILSLAKVQRYHEQTLVWLKVALIDVPDGFQEGQQFADVAAEIQRDYTSVAQTFVRFLEREGGAQKLAIGAVRSLMTEQASAEHQYPGIQCLQAELLKSQYSYLVNETDS